MGDALEELLGCLPAAGPTTFRAVTEGMESRIDVVVRFLAVLELYKQGLVELDQGRTFGELRITWTGGDDVGRAAPGWRGPTAMARRRAAPGPWRRSCWWRRSRWSPTCWPSCWR